MISYSQLHLHSLMFKILQKKQTLYTVLTILINQPSFISYISIIGMLKHPLNTMVVGEFSLYPSYFFSHGPTMIPPGWVSQHMGNDGYNIKYYQIVYLYLKHKTKTSSPNNLYV